MKRRLCQHLLLGAAISVTPAFAQDDAGSEPNETCLMLFTYADESDRYEVDEMPELLAVVERNSAAACNRYLRRLQREEATGQDERSERAIQTLTDRQQNRQQTERETETAIEETDRETVATETRRVQEEVELSETVTVQGTVDVMAASPEILVEQQAPRVRVTDQAPRVSVRNPGAQIVIQEQAPTIRIGMPTITIEQPAPVIEVIMPDPSVDVENQEPRVEVIQQAPNVRVAMPDPEIDLDLRAVAGESEGVQTRVSRGPSAAPQERDGMRLVARQDDGAEANVYLREAEARVERTNQDAEPNIQIEREQPSVRFVRAEPQVEMTGEPEVNFERTGEPRINFRSAQDGREQTAGDLTGMTVRDRDGEEIGEVGRVVQLGSTVYAVLEHGGFLGVGSKEVPIPLSDLSFRGDRLVAENLTEARVEELSDRELPDDMDLSDETPLTIRSQQGD